MASANATRRVGVERVQSASDASTSSSATAKVLEIAVMPVGSTQTPRHPGDAGEMSGATAMMALGKQVLKGQLLGYFGCTVETGVECTNPIAHS